jgi:hypothetical protein
MGTLFSWIHSGMHSNNAGDPSSSGQIFDYQAQFSRVPRSELEVVGLAHADDLSRRAYQRLCSRQIRPILGYGAPCNRYGVPEQRQSQWQCRCDVYQPDTMETSGLHLDDWGTRAIQGDACPASSPR